jgi:hypothetical protein
MNPAEVIIREMQAVRGPQVLPLFRKRIRQPREATHAHSDGEILALDMGRANFRRIGIAHDWDSLRVRDIRRAVGALAFGVLRVAFDELREIATVDLDLAILAKLCSGHAGFSFHLSKPRLFQNYLYFSPNPSAPFICLTRAVLAQYPRLTPYGGRFGKAVIPHLSVAFSEDAAVLETVAAAVSNVEVHATAHEIHLMDCRDGWWRPVAAFQLGDAS